MQCPEVWYLWRAGGFQPQSLAQIDAMPMDLIITLCDDLDWAGDREAYDRGPVMPPERR